MDARSALPLFHLYGDPPDDQAFDFIHIETIASRSSAHDWTIGAHQHRNLLQILVIDRGGGAMTHEAAVHAFTAPAAILVPARVVHGFAFRPLETDGWVVTLSEDVADGLGGLAALADPIIRLAEGARLSKLCAELHAEAFLARASHRLAMRSYLALIAVEVGRLAASRARSGTATSAPADATVETLRQRVLIEAKRALIFTNQPIHEIAYDLAFADPSHFARFFRQQTGTTPQAFRERRAG